MKTRHSRFGALSKNATIWIFAIVVVLFIIGGVLFYYYTKDSSPSPTPSPTKTITKAVKSLVTTAKALITPAPTTKKGSTPAPTTKKGSTPASTTKKGSTPARTTKKGSTPAPTKFISKYKKVDNFLGSESQYDCPGAKNVLNGGINCEFPTKEDAENYCNSERSCPGYSINKLDPNNKIAQAITIKNLASAGPDLMWDWFQKVQP